MPKGKGKAVKLTESPKSKPTENKSESEDKVVKRLVIPEKEGPNGDKDGLSKSSVEPVMNISSKSASAVVNGEANIG